MTVQNPTSTVLDLSPQELAGLGAAHTAREIAQQPAVWRRVQRLLDEQRAALDAFLEPVLARGELRIVFTGAGSSAFIGQCLAPALLRELGHRRGIRIEALASTDIVSSPEQCLQAGVPTLLVSFARSGNSPESLAAISLADGLVQDCHHLAITCAADGALSRGLREHARAFVLLLPEETNDRAFAMTSSFSGMLLAAAWAFKLPLLPAPSLGQACSRLVHNQIERLQTLAEAPIERLVVLGSNSLLGLAREAALKMLELTDGELVATADSTLGFRHGPKTILNEHTLVLLIVSNDAYTRRYDLDLLHELRREGRAAGVLALHAGSIEPAHADDVRLSLPSDAPDLALAPVALVFAQYLALLSSLRLGRTPDNPSTSGTVSRVVKGVTIHPLKPQPAQ
jgi:tagatose-6-phosphate ketose/aldose isomerase